MASEPQDSEPPMLFDESCCGDEIRTTVLGRQKKAWVACGSALEHFESKIMPHIGPIIRNVDLSDADLYMRLYMIGKTKQTASPMIAVICSDVTVAKNSKKALKSSSLLVNDHPSFNIGRFPRPLGHSTQIRPLAATTQRCTRENFNFNFHNEPTLLSTTNAPTIGRPLVLASQTSRYATGGVTIYLREADQHFQLTAGHLFDTDESADLSQPPTQDEDACSFDGQSDDDEESDIEPRSQEDSLSFASRSFCGDDDDFLDKDSIFSHPGPPIETEIASYQKPGSLADHNTGIKSTQVDPKELVEAGSLSLHSRDGDNPQLDYAMIAIDRPRLDDQGKVNILNVPRDRTPTDCLHIQQIATPKLGTKTPIFAVTTSGDVTSGLIIPGPMYVRKPHGAEFQTLYVARLDGPLTYGDSGSAIVDGSSGNLYGHIISGCASENTAYVVPAREVFDDINRVLRARINPGLAENNYAVIPDIQLCGIQKNDLVSDTRNSNLQSALDFSGTVSTRSFSDFIKHFTASLISKQPPTLLLLIMNLFTLICLAIYAFLLLLILNIIESSISDDPRPFWDASTTNYVLSLLTQLFVLMIGVTDRSMSATLDNFLASAERNFVAMVAHMPKRRPIRRGGALQPFPRVFGITLKLSSTWLLLLLTLSGTMLKYNASFEYYFLPTTTRIMFVGQLPFSEGSSERYSTFPRPVNVPRSLIAYPIENCTTDCEAFLTPTKLRSLKQYILNSCTDSPWDRELEILESEAIRIDGAPGHIVEFQAQNKNASLFEFNHHCSESGYTILDDTPLLLCAKQVGRSIDAGLAWSRTRLPNVTEAYWISMSRIAAYYVQTRTVYHTKNETIAESEVKSGRSTIYIDADDYLGTLKDLLVAARLGDVFQRTHDRSSDQLASAADLALDLEGHRAFGRLLYSLGWPSELELPPKLRDLGDPATPQSLLALPIWLSLDNYSSNSSTFVFSAQGGKSSNHLVILPWTGWVYIGISTGIMAALVCCYNRITDPAHGRPRTRSAAGVTSQDSSRTEDISGPRRNENNLDIVADTAAAYSTGLTVSNLRRKEGSSDESAGRE